MTSAPPQPTPTATSVAAYLRDLAARGARRHIGLCRTDLDMIIAAAGLIELAFAPRTSLVAEVERRREEDDG